MKKRGGFIHLAIIFSVPWLLCFFLLSLYIIGIINCLCIMLAVAFLTLLERKILSYIQNRKGPNKVGVGGLLQPIRDAVKLIFKELTVPLRGNSLFFFLCPLGGLILGLVLWFLYP